MKSDSSTYSAESGGSASDLKEHRKDSNVYIQPTGTNTPIGSTPTTGAGKTIIQATLGKSKPVVSPITTFSVLASLAKHSRLPERGKGLRTLVERFSSRLPALRGLKNPVYYSWRMSRDSSATTTDRLLG